MIEVKQEGDFIWITEANLDIERVDFLNNLVQTMDAELIDFSITFQDLISTVDVTPTHTNIYLNLMEAFEKLAEFDEKSDDEVQYSLTLLFYKKRCGSYGLACKDHD